MRAALLLTLVLAACSGDKPSSNAVTAQDAPRLLVDRNWLDVWPERHDEHLHVVRFVPSMGGGVFQDRTVFKGQFELFTFHADGRRLQVGLPHTHEKFDTAYRIERVTGPEPFDLKLTLDRNPRGPEVYYSIAAQGGATAAELDAQLPQLP